MHRAQRGLAAPRRSPNADQDGELIADDLTRIKELAASAFTQEDPP